MKKVMSFIGCALFVAAMTVACGGNTENTDSTDSLNNAEVVETETPAPADQEATVDNSAREAAIAEAAEKICTEDALVVCDNILLKGWIVQAEGSAAKRHRTSIKYMKKFLDYLCQRDDLEVSILTGADGLAIIRFKK